MTLADIVAVMSGPDRVRITKGSNELFAGYLGNLVHMAEYEALMAEEVTRLKEKVDITHKRYKEDRRGHSQRTKCVRYRHIRGRKGKCQEITRRKNA